MTFIVSIPRASPRDLAAKRAGAMTGLLVAVIVSDQSVAKCRESDGSAVHRVTIKQSPATSGRIWGELMDHVHWGIKP